MNRLKGLIIYLVLICLLLPSLASAMSQTEWDQECRAKTSGTTLLYSKNDSGEFVEIGSLPSGTYIKAGTYDYDSRMWNVAYWNAGSRSSAWVKRENVIAAETMVHFSDGTSTSLPEALVKDSNSLRSYIQKQYPGKSLKSDSSRPTNIDGTDPLPPSTPSPVYTSDETKEDTIQGDWSKEKEATNKEKEFNADCVWRLQRTVTGYSDAKMTKMYETINIGTYCQITTDFDNVVKITYYKNSEKHSAHVYRSALLGSYTQYVDENGDTHSISSAHPDHASIIENCEVTWLAESIQQDLDAKVEAERTAAKNGDQVATSGAATVSLTRLGVATSTIVYNGEEKEVLTSELTFAQDVPEGKEIAIIYAPNTGKCSLRSKASESAKAIKQCKAGTVVSVLEYGGKFCMINYDGQVGYVLTRCLQFCDSKAEPIGTGVLTYNGKATGRTTINIRNDADGDAAKISEWKTGTEVTVFGLADGWYEIESNGVHGYVMEKFLTIKE